MFIENIYFSETDEARYSGFDSGKTKRVKPEYPNWKEYIKSKQEPFKKKERKINKIKISKAEKIFNEITPDIVKYAGNKRDSGIKTKKKTRYPDFKIEGQNKVIEIFGIYWHDVFKVRRFGKPDSPEDLIEEYKEIGIKCLVIWEYELTKIYRYEGYPKPDLEKVLKRTLEFIKYHTNSYVK